MTEINDPENTIVMETTKGRVVIKLLPDVAPAHVARIKELARDNFYDGIVFHRVIDGFMAQTGDPTGTGMGGSEKPDLKAEFSDADHVRGTCSMARSQNPNSANSQFFICFEDAPWLNRQYSVWGQVIEGMDNVDRIKRGEPVRDPEFDPLHAGRGRPRLIAAGATRFFRVASSRRIRGPCSSDVHEMRVDLFDFELPEERIALRPASPRDSARMLVVRPGGTPPLEDRSRAAICPPSSSPAMRSS